jgi:hypothetical protein
MIGRDGAPQFAIDGVRRASGLHATTEAGAGPSFV